MVNYSDRKLDRVFAALGDPSRRAILSRLEREERLSVSAIARPLSIKLPAVMKHLGVLEDAGLITRVKHGRTVEIRLSPAPLQQASGWLHSYEPSGSPALGRLVADVQAQSAEAISSEADVLRMDARGGPVP